MYLTMLSAKSFTDDEIELLEFMYDKIASFSFYFVLILGLALAATATLLYFKSRERLKGFKTFTLGTALGCAAAIIGIMTFFSVYIAYTKGRLNDNFYLVVCLLLFTIVAAITVAISALFNKKAAKLLVAMLSALGLIFGIICAFVIFKNKGGDYVILKGKKSLYYALTAVLVVCLVLFAIIFKRKGSYSDTKAITYAAVCIAISFALSYVKFFSMGQGGSVTLASLLPLMLYSYMFGVRKGIFAGIVYGVLQFFQSPQVYEGVQFFLDYPIAFGFIGVAGLFRNNKLFKDNKIAEFIAGAVLAMLFRYASHVISGIFVFYSWAAWVDWAKGYVTYSFGYNSFIFVDLAIIIVTAIPLFLSKSFKKELDRINPIEKQHA